MKTKTQSFNQKTRDWWRSKINIYGFLSIKKTFFLFGIRLNTYVCNISLTRSFYVFVFPMLVNMLGFFFGAHLILFGARVCLYENSVIAYNRPKLKTSTLFHLKLLFTYFLLHPLTLVASIKVMISLLLSCFSVFFSSSFNIPFHCIL